MLPGLFEGHELKYELYLKNLYTRATAHFHYAVDVTEKSRSECAPFAVRALGAFRYTCRLLASVPAWRE